MSEPIPEPKASVVISTRNRGTKISATIESLLASDEPHFELLVVDQSTNDDTEKAVMQFDDPRIVYVRTDTVGTGRSRRIGLAVAATEYVLYTDDDCLAPTDWISEMLRPFEADEQVGVVFCEVSPLVKEFTEGFTPAFEFRDDSLVTSLWRYYHRHGMGAGMGVRKSAMIEIGGFDPMLGPGSRFMSGEDADIAIRALIADWHVYNTAQTTIVHDGLRVWDDYTALARRDWYALGALYGKPLRRGKPAVYWITAYQLLYRCLTEPLLKVFRGQRPKGFKRFLFLVQGLIDGWRYPIDGPSLVYVDQPR